MSSEFARIDRLQALLSRPSPEVSLGIGDDCAVLRPSAHPRVWTVDAAVEGVHFSRAFMRLQDVGYRAFMAATSDVAAMGGRAVAALSALVLPTALNDDDVFALIEGLAAASDASGCPIIGGNLARGGELSLTTSVLGECAVRVLTRAQARQGDGIYVSGPLGASALGLILLQRSLGEVCQAAVAAFLRPRARLDVALEIASFASAAIDVSDGFAQDLGHLCHASQVGARVDVSALPRLAGFDDAAAHVGEDADRLACSGGEDYELIFTSTGPVDPALGTRVGEITDRGAGLQLIDARGQAVAIAGFDHFARG